MSERNVMEKLNLSLGMLVDEGTLGGLVKINLGLIKAVRR